MFDYNQNMLCKKRRYNNISSSGNRTPFTCTRYL